MPTEDTFKGKLVEKCSTRPMPTDDQVQIPVNKTD